VSPPDAPGPLAPFGRAPIGVFAYVRGDGTPNAVPVTPFVVDGRIVVTSTLAYVTKAAAVRRNPRVALLAGRWSVATTAAVAVDPTPAWFNANIREVEIAKFPPTEHFLGIPFHECLFPWYSGRVVIGFDPVTPEPAPSDDRGGRLTVHDRRGSLAVGPSSVAAQLSTIRTMRRSARANRARVAGWPTVRAS
jgi:hypothetical protein